MMMKKVGSGSGLAMTASSRPTIEKIPFFGTTWYKRGPAYWFRRLLASLMMLVALAVALAIMWGLVAAIVVDHAVPLAVRGLGLALIALASGHSMVRAWQAFVTVERRRRAGEMLRQPDLVGDRRQRRAGLAGAVTGTTAIGGSLAGGALLVIGVVGYLGWFIVMFVWTLQREYGIEHDARVRFERWRQEHGHVA